MAKIALIALVLIGCQPPLNCPENKQELRTVHKDFYLFKLAVRRWICMEE